MVTMTHDETGIPSVTLLAASAELLWPLWERFPFSDGANAVVCEARAVMWTPERRDEAKAHSEALEALVPDEDSEGFRFQDAFASNALVAILYVLTTSLGPGNDAHWVAAQLEEAADLADTITNGDPGQTPHQGTTFTARAEKALKKVQALQGSTHSRDAVQEQAILISRDLWASLTVPDAF